MLQSIPPCAACSGVQLVSAECGPGMQTAALQRCTDMVTAGAAPCAPWLLISTDLITVIVAQLPIPPIPAVFIERIFAEQNEMFYISDARTFFS